MRFVLPLPVLSLLVLLGAAAISSRGLSFTLKTAPFGPEWGMNHRDAENSKWRRNLPGETLKLGKTIQFLVPLDDYSKILFSEDQKVFQLLDLQSGEIRKAFQQREESSWTRAAGRTVVTHLGFSERYLLRSFPDFEPEGLWTPPAGSKARGFCFGSKSREFLCLTSDNLVHQVSLDTIKATAKPVAIDDYWDGRNARPSFLANRRELHLKQSSPDLETVIMGAHYYRKDAPISKKVVRIHEDPHDRSEVILAGNGKRLPAGYRPVRPFSAPPESSIFAACFAGDSSRLHFFDVSKGYPLFTVLTPSSNYLRPSKGIHKVVFCQALDTLVLVLPESGELGIFKIDVEAMSRVYPSQTSRQRVTARSLETFSYLPRFSRSEFIEGYEVASGLSSSFEIDPRSGRISAKNRSPKEDFRRFSIRFRANLKGGDAVFGRVTVVPEDESP